MQHINYVKPFIAFFNRKFSSSTNDIQTRVVKILSEALHNPRAPLATHYGCIIGLGELGHGVSLHLTFPHGLWVNSCFKIMLHHVINKYCCSLISFVHTMN